MKTHFYFLFLVVYFLFQISFSFAQNENPVAVNDTLIIHSPGQYTINVLDNDHDPDGDSIFIYRVDEHIDGLDITFSSTQVHIIPTSYSGYYESIDYRISDTADNTDRAKIIVQFLEHPEAVKTVEDTILVESQIPIELNLIENDIYYGVEELKLISVSGMYGGSFEILADSQSVRFVSNAYNGPSHLFYTVVEKGGEEYVSKGSGFLFISKNNDEPIARSDTFEVQAGQVHYLDVLANDLPQGKIELNSIITENANLSIENSKIKFSVPENYVGGNSIIYDIIDIESQLKSMPIKVRVNVLPSPNKPIAVIDTIEFVYTGEEMEIFPLANDINPTGNPLVIDETGSESMFVNYNSQTGWFEKNYHAIDTISGLLSSEQIIHIHVLPPDSIQVSDIYIEYTLGDMLHINPFEGTNIPDSISSMVRPQIGKYNHQNQTYSFDILDYENLLYNEWLGIRYLNDTIEITFTFKDGYHSFYVRKYLYVHYNPVQFYSSLHVNNVHLNISPNGFHYNDINYPGNSEMNPILTIHPWMSDYTNQQTKRVSGNINLYYGADFVYGPLVDDYSGVYGGGIL